MPYERRRARLVPRGAFLRRLAAHGGVALGLLAVSLAIGMWGYARFEGLAWRDAFLNASMLLGGMGPVDAPRTPDGKLFAGVYALYAGLVFLATAGIVAAPVVHRLMHRFHFEDDGER
jgi:hypothetical protein